MIKINNPDETSEGPWPPFSQIGEFTAFPMWIAECADQLISKYGDKLKCIQGEMWARQNYKFTSHHSDIGPVWNKDDTPTEDQLDHVPAMRKMMRMADTINGLWDFLPMHVDDEHNTYGENTYILSRNGLFFEWANMESDEYSFYAVATWDGSAWTYQESIKVYDVEAPETAIASRNAQMILEAINPGEYGLSEWPDLSTAELEIDEDDEALIFHFSHGLFDAFIPSETL